MKKTIKNINNKLSSSTTVTFDRVSMDTARTMIRDVCEQDPRANLKIVVSYGSNGIIESRNIVVTSGIVLNGNVWVPKLRQSNR